MNSIFSDDFECLIQILEKLQVIISLFYLLFNYSCGLIMETVSSDG